ncbi:hypothetical protein SAMN04488505_105321 [Chitinophaga rupis]|uniref:Uncharacterized protein n=1 Tax=Chitinophaga rupis TaxID=573321 RepID=A0A1H8A4G1_9BACT|nr:hypothetical protein [Chitinophaga rupis]SEM65772.1 hypothetical protein SAMN04488505_105321 [Chitinophaga rupis]
MEAKRRYTVMVFPQGFDGKKLALNIVLIPRNQDPFTPYATGLPAPDDNATPFADLVPQFEIGVVKGLDEWPLSNATAAGRVPVKIPVAIAAAANKKALLQAIAADLGAKINVDNTTDKAEAVIPESTSVRKYLPLSYRESFNFTSPRHPNARTDDSYHCAIRKDTKKKPGWATKDDLSWGQVFAHILRQPLLARACGMIYQTEVSVEDNAALFEKGCYLYADLVNADYVPIQNALLEDADGPFVKRYAARIPKLKVDTPRPVFAPLLFPVLYRKTIDAVDPEPKGEWDKIFAELNEYNDGFAKIVHVTQPVSSNLLSEQQDGAHPVKDAGIRLAWDDEQILIWYIRQLAQNPLEPGKRVDAPLGVFGYRIDVKQEGVDAWNSLNLVRSKQSYNIGGASVGNAANEEVELPFQVFPTQPDNNTAGAYWLPMYFTNWIGKSLVLKDHDAVLIYQNEQGVIKDDGGDIIAQQNVPPDNLFDEVATAAKLLYGNTYEFRVRMQDISGGGPAIGEELFNNAASPTAKRLFKRYIAPGLCRIDKPAQLISTQVDYFNESVDEANVHTFDASPVLHIRRPLLNYPAVVFTGKYQAAGQDPVQLLIQSNAAQGESKTPAIADPDVVKAEVKVEVETLRLDNLLSDSGEENYVTLYRTTRAFPAGFDDELTLPVVFHDIASLNLGNLDDPFNDATLNKPAIDAMTDIPLPTARRIRVTVRGVCEGDSAYYGFINDANPDLDSRYGKTTQFRFYKESGTEANLLLPKANVTPVQGVYLQPDPPYVNDGTIASLFFIRESADRMPDMVQRLAQQLGVVSRNLTLVGKKGERVVFGCNNKIRHHLAPDHSSITFSSKGDLSNHWIGCVVYRLNRDWSWDALQDVGFTISRKKKFKHDTEAEAEVLDVLGDIELKHYASFESLIPDEFGIVNRNSTTLVFIDAIEPKTALKQSNGQLRFPDELQVTYTLTPNFKPNHGAPATFTQEQLDLPATVIPAQVPKIASVGIAFSPYRKNERYSATEPRQRYLWVELEEPVADPHDTVFCRLLQYAPDQMLSNNIGIANDVTEDPPLPIDPEYTRSIAPNQTDDMAGLSAMQAMEKASDNDNVHYLLPLPPGLHAESAELFGFFTYEFRMGHGHWSNAEDNKENLWSTAQGRFGRPLRVTGIQHPAPTLLCNVDRDKDRVYVNAPYAKAVWKGKDVTPDPPRTQMHAVLYAQVKQADGLAYRNILLDEKLMQLSRPPVVKIPDRDFGVLYNAGRQELHRWTVEQTDEPARAGVLLTNLTMLNEVNTLRLDPVTQRKLDQVIQERAAGKVVDLDRDTSRKLLKAYDALQDAPLKVTPLATQSFTTASLVAGALVAIFKDQVKTATITWENKEIAALLMALGLPEDSPLSVLTVEVFGNITSLYEHIGLSLPEIKKLTANNPQVYAAIESRQLQSQYALTNALGKYRILRTSPLTEVPFVCCPTCAE